MTSSAVSALVMLALVVAATGSWVGYSTAIPEGYALQASHNASRLYTVTAPQGVAENFGYDSPVYLLVLEGSHYQMGYDYGALVGQKVLDLASLFLHNLVSKNAVVQAAVREFCVWQYDAFLGKATPDIYAQELAGIGAANPSALRDVKTIITLANFPGTITDLRYVLEKEIFGSDLAAARTMDVMTMLDVILIADGMDPARARRIAAGLQALVDANYKSFGCSMFGIWGNRTQGGNVFSARNLDWASSTGANTGKVVTVFKPNDGGVAHATFGFIGFYGALAGVSAEGISVHEANLEEGEAISFKGMAWVLRLRYIMEKSKHLDSALTLWNDEHNTVGFNFGIMSQPDRAGVVIETNDIDSYIFHADSPVEAAATIEYEGKTVQYGFPMTDAVYRTNAAYAPETRKYYSWSQSRMSNSELRYLLIRDGFVNYAEDGVLVGMDQALNITAIVAAKSKQEPAGDPYHCPPMPQPTPTGSNIVSATNDLASLTSYVAWGNGNGATWRAACCNTYAAFDLTKWF
ncbi:uncharacterized protein AMSG_11041 [Thecamonas trahens ATCC 50062]|uniref:Phospholipase B-like n=1 Tax=Thecamonas trahens ATCC 50062 TaxID=461836 RepID=A0A0L0DV23_THETB|nr:hypothetical protein AMSG_11041 [Thecamonas trahens ATCC 50062]KNC55383.1 hypothetical protein AMSG_11041 [Thecamonas trahens ATCC 50062]|eukprot:XP_013753015.1 hypothetical protein AMSG_11041 [Thecamonas trahens ATCC 50062]